MKSFKHIILAFVRYNRGYSLFLSGSNLPFGTVVRGKSGRKDPRMSIKVDPDSFLRQSKTRLNNFSFVI